MAETSIKRRVARVILVLGALTCVVFGLAVAYLSTDAFLERARVTAVESANASLNAKLSIEKIEGSVWSELTLRNVRLETLDQKPLLEVETVAVTYALWGALSRDLVVNSVVVDGMTAYVVKDGESFEWTQITKPDDSPPPAPPEFNIDLEAISVTNSRIAYLDSAQHPDVDRKDVGDLVKRDSTAIGAAFVSELGLLASARVALAGDTTVVVKSLESSVAVETLEPVALNLTGVEAALGDTLNIKVSKLAAGEWVALDGVTATLEGDSVLAAFHAVVSPKLSGVITKFGGPELLQEIDVHASVAGTSSLPSLELQLGTKTGGTVEATVTQGEAGSWDAKLTLAQVAPQLLIRPSPIDALISGKAGCSGSSLEFATMKATCTLQLTPTRIDIYQINSLAAELALADQTVTVKQVRLDTPYASGTASASFGLASGEFSIETELGSGTEMPDALKKVVKNQDVAVTGKLTATGQLDLQADDPMAMLQRLDAAGNWNLQNFEAEDIQVPKSQGNFEVALTPRENEMRVVARADATARGIRSRKIRLNSLDFVLRANGSAPWPPKDPLVFVRNLGATLKLNVNGLNTPQVVANRAEVDATLKPLSKDRVAWSLKANGNTLKAGGTSIDRVRTDVRGSATIDANVTGLDMLRRVEVQGTAGASGVVADGAKLADAAADIDVAGPPRSLTGRVDIAATGVDAASYAFDALDANVTLKSNRKFEITAHATQPEKLPAEFDAKITGAYRSDFSGWDIDDVQIKAGEGDWAIENGASLDPSRGIYAFDNATIRHKDQTIKIDGRFRQGKDQDLTVEVTNFSIAEAPKQFGIQGVPDVKGVVNGRAKASGTARDPSFDFDLTFKDLTYETFGPFDVHVVGNYGKDHLELTTLEVDGYGQRIITAAARVPVHLETTGNYEIFWDEAFSVAAHTEGLQVGSFGPLVQALVTNSVSGVLSFDVTLEGKLAEPKLDANFDLLDFAAVLPSSNDDIEVGPLGLAAKFVYRTPKGSSDGLTADIKLKDAKGDGIALRGSAAFPVARLIKETLTGAPTDQLRANILKSPFTFAVVMRDYDVQRLNISPLQKAKAEGAVTFLLTMQGTPENPKAKLFGRLAKFGWDRFRDIYIDVEADLTEELLDVSKVRVEWDADEVLTGRAKIPVPMQVLLGAKQLEDLPLDLELAIPSLPIAKLSAVDYTFASIRGKMQALLTLKGSLTKPTINASAKLTETLFANKKTGSITIEALAKDNRVTALAEVDHQGVGVATIRADAPVLLDVLQVAAGADMRAPGDLKMSMKADGVEIAGLFPPKILDNFVTNVKGKATSNLGVTGSWAAPALTGSLKLSGLNVFFPSLGRKVEDGSLQIEAADGGLNIVELYAAENQGYIDAQGRIDLEMLAPSRVAFTMNLKEFGTSGFTPMPTYVSASLWSEVDLTKAEKNVRMGINDLVVNVPESQQGSTFPTSLDSDIVVLNPLKSTATPGLENVTSAPKQSVLAKLQIDIAPGAQLKHPNAQIEFQGKLAVDVAGAQTAIFGDITSTGGKIEFLGKQFRVDQGIVTFSGNTPPNPRLQVEASYIFDRSVADELGPPSSGDPRAVVRVYGTALRPQLRMSSDPQLTESQIIYVLVSDRAPEAAQGGEEEGVASQAIAAASGLLSGMLKERAKSVYPIDMLRLQTAEGTISGVQVGKYFGKDLFFSYEFIFGADEGENTNEFRLEYQFAPRWLMGTRFGDQANGAVFLYWNVY